MDKTKELVEKLCNAIENGSVADYIKTTRPIRLSIGNRYGIFYGKEGKRKAMVINRDLLERNYNIIKGIKGMNDTRIAERLHVHRSRIKAIVSRPTPLNVQCLAYGLDTPIDFLEKPIEEKTIREIESSRYHDDSGERP